MNRNCLDIKGRPFKKLDKITYSGMLHYDDIRKAFNNLSLKGNLTRYYFLYEFLKQIYILCLFLINIKLNLLLFKI